MKKYILGLVAMLLVTVAKADQLTVSPVSVKAGEAVDVWIELATENNYSSFQFDVVLPEGLTFVQYKSGRQTIWGEINSDRIVDHTLKLAPSEENKSMKCLSFSAEAEYFYNEDEEGNPAPKLLKLKVQAADDAVYGEYIVAINNIVFNDKKIAAYTFEDTSFTINVEMSQRQEDNTNAAQADMEKLKAIQADVTAAVNANELPLSEETIALINDVLGDSYAMAIEAAYGEVVDAGEYASPIDWDELEEKVEAIKSGIEAAKKAEADRQEANDAAVQADVDKLEALQAAVTAATIGNEEYISEETTALINDVLGDSYAMAIEAAYGEVAEAGEYASPIDWTALEEKVEAIKSDIEATKEAAYKASDDKADELKAELGDLKSYLADVLEMLDKYETFEEEGNIWIGNANYLIDKAEAELAEAKANHALTAESELPYAQNIEDAIKEIAKQATKEETLAKIEEAAAALEAAKEAVNSCDHANQAELEEKIAELEEQLEALEATDDWTAINEVLEPAGNIVSQSEAIIEEASKAEVLYGDINQDGKVNVLDYNRMCTYILGDKNISDAAFRAGNINGEGDIDVTDLVALINKILHIDDSAESRQDAPAANSGALSISSSKMGAVTRYAINLSGRSYAAAMIEFSLSEVAQIVGESLGEAASGMELGSRTFANGNHRVLLSSIEGNTMSEGTLLYIDVMGDANIEVAANQFADQKGGSQLLAVGGPATGIDAIGAEGGNAAIYSINGAQARTMQKGINIVVGADGSAKKVLKK